MTDQPTPSPISISLTAGPCLTYLHSDQQTASIVDRHAITGDRRERAICRALLQTALDLLDDTEPTNPNGTANR